MKNIKTFVEYSRVYEIFDGLFGKKNETNSAVSDIFENIHKNYKKLKFMSSEIKKNEISISYMDKSGSFILYYLVSPEHFTQSNGEYKILVSILGKNKENRTEIITEDQYNKIKEIATEISDYLDSESDKKRSSVGPDGDLNLEVSDADLYKLEASHMLKKILGDKIQKEYEFEIKELKGDSQSEVKMIKIVDIVPESSFGDGKIFLRIHLKIDGDDYLMDLYQNTPTNYIDLDKRGPMQKVIFAHPNKDGMTRAEIRNDKRPGYDITPFKYNTIEMLNLLKDVLFQINDQIK